MFLKFLAFLAVWSMSMLNARAADDLTKPIRVSPDGHFLVQPDGEPFFWLGDTAWELFHRLTRDETDRYLRARARQGFNVIQAVATGKLDTKGLVNPNRDGEVPFVDADPARPNERYFQHIDWVVDRAAHYGLRVALLPVWGSLFVSGGGPTQVFNAANAQTYGRWLAHRYRGKGIIWVLGGDMTPIAPVFARDDKGQLKGSSYSTVVDYRPVYDAMAEGITAGEGGDPFITYHPPGASPSGAAVPRMSLYFGDRDWFDMSMLQSCHFGAGSGEEGGGNYRDLGGLFTFVWNGRFNYLPVAAEYRAVPTRPVIDGETRYEDHPIFGTALDAIGFWQPQDQRNAIYHAVFAGAAGHTYGNFSVWDLHDPARRTSQPAGSYDKLFEKYKRLPWQEALDAQGAGQMQHARKLLLSRPYFSRIPDQALIVGEQGQGHEHIGATRDRDGTYAMVYVPQGQTVTVDLAKINGSSAVGWWFDPRTGAARKLDKTFPIAEQTPFIPPTRGKDQDWVLVLDSEGSRFGPPGVAP